jgi:hypothetical protein
VRSLVFKFVYLTAIAVATIGWLWMLFDGVARTLDI